MVLDEIKGAIGRSDYVASFLLKNFLKNPSKLDILDFIDYQQRS